MLLTFADDIKYRHLTGNIQETVTMAQQFNNTGKLVGTESLKMVQLLGGNFFNSRIVISQSIKISSLPSRVSAARIC